MLYREEIGTMAEKPATLEHLRGALAEVGMLREAVAVMVLEKVPLHMNEFRTNYNHLERQEPPVCGTAGCIIGNIAHLPNMPEELAISPDDFKDTWWYGPDVYINYAQRVTKHLFELRFYDEVEASGVSQDDVWDFLFGSYHPNCYNAFLGRLDDVEDYILSAIEELEEE